MRDPQERAALFLGPTAFRPCFDNVILFLRLLLLSFSHCPRPRLGARTPQNCTSVQLTAHDRAYYRTAVPSAQVDTDTALAAHAPGSKQTP